MSGDVGAEVAASIREAWHETGFYARADLSPEWLDGLAKITADALAPLIDKRVEAAKAEALREAADDLEATRDEHKAEDEAEGCESRFCGGWLLGQTHAAQKLRDRAATLDPEARRDGGRS